jgi:hypothetical protein
MDSSLKKIIPIAYSIQDALLIYSVHIFTIICIKKYNFMYANIQQILVLSSNMFGCPGQCMDKDKLISGHISGFVCPSSFP